MTLWLEEKKGLRLEVENGALVYYDAKAQRTSYGKVIVDDTPKKAAKKLASAICDETPLGIAAFMVKLAWGGKGPLTELIPVGGSQLLVLFSPPDTYWYSREIARVLLVETAQAMELIALLRSETGSDLLHSKGPINGCWMHFAAEKSREIAGGWQGKTLVSYDGDAEKFPRKFAKKTLKSFEEAEREFATWLVDAMRQGQCFSRVRVESDLPMDKDAFEAFEEACGPKATKKLAKEALKAAKGKTSRATEKRR